MKIKLGTKVVIGDSVYPVNPGTVGTIREIATGISGRTYFIIDTKSILGRDVNHFFVLEEFSPLFPKEYDFEL